MIHCAQRALPPKGGDLCISLFEEFRDKLTLFLSPMTGWGSPAKLSPSSRIGLPSRRHIRTELQPRFQLPPETVTLITSSGTKQDQSKWWPLTLRAKIEVREATPSLDGPK